MPPTNSDHETKRRRDSRVRAARLTACLVTMLTGCGSDLSSVTGTLTLDGRPLAGGETVGVTVLLFPETGVGVPAAGRADESGEYEISTGSQQGIKPGAYLVAISGVEVIPPKTEQEMPGRRQLTPLRYADPKQSGFRVDVKPGSNECDFDLHSDN